MSSPRRIGELTATIAKTADTGPSYLETLSTLGGAGAGAGAGGFLADQGWSEAGKHHWLDDAGKPTGNYRKAGKGDTPWTRSENPIPKYTDALTSRIAKAQRLLTRNSANLSSQAARHKDLMGAGGIWKQFMKQIGSQEDPSGKALRGAADKIGLGLPTLEGRSAKLLKHMKMLKAVKKFGPAAVFTALIGGGGALGGLLGNKAYGGISGLFGGGDSPAEKAGSVTATIAKRADAGDEIAGGAGGIFGGIGGAAAGDVINKGQYGMAGAGRGPGWIDKLDKSVGRTEGTLGKVRGLKDRYSAQQSAARTANAGGGGLRGFGSRLESLMGDLFDRRELGSSHADHMEHVGKRVSRQVGREGKLLSKLTKLMRLRKFGPASLLGLLTAGGVGAGYMSGKGMHKGIKDMIGGGAAPSQGRKLPAHLNKNRLGPGGMKQSALIEGENISGGLGGLLGGATGAMAGDRLGFGQRTMWPDLTNPVDVMRRKNTGVFSGISAKENKLERLLERAGGSLGVMNKRHAGATGFRERIRDRLSRVAIGSDAEKAQLKDLYGGASKNMGKLFGRSQILQARHSGMLSKLMKLKGITKFGPGALLGLLTGGGALAGFGLARGAHRDITGPKSTQARRELMEMIRGDRPLGLNPINAKESAYREKQAVAPALAALLRLLPRLLGRAGRTAGKLVGKAGKQGVNIASKVSGKGGRKLIDRSGQAAGNAYRKLRPPKSIRGTTGKAPPRKASGTASAPKPMPVRAPRPTSAPPSKAYTDAMIKRKGGGALGYNASQKAIAKTQGRAPGTAMQVYKPGLPKPMPTRTGHPVDAIKAMQASKGGISGMKGKLPTEKARYAQNVGAGSSPAALKAKYTRGPVPNTPSSLQSYNPAGPGQRLGGAIGKGVDGATRAATRAAGGAGRAAKREILGAGRAAKRGLLGAGRAAKGGLLGAGIPNALKGAVPIAAAGVGGYALGTGKALPPMPGLPGMPTVDSMIEPWQVPHQPQFGESWQAQPQPIPTPQGQTSPQTLGTEGLPDYSSGDLRGIHGEGVPIKEASSVIAAVGQATGVQGMRKKANPFQQAREAVGGIADRFNSRQPLDLDSLPHRLEGQPKSRHSARIPEKPESPYGVGYDPIVEDLKGFGGRVKDNVMGMPGQIQEGVAGLHRKGQEMMGRMPQKTMNIRGKPEPTPPPITGPNLRPAGTQWSQQNSQTTQAPAYQPPLEPRAQPTPPGQPGPGPMATIQAGPTFDSPADLVAGQRKAFEEIGAPGFQPRAQPTPPERSPIPNLNRPPQIGGAMPGRSQSGSGSFGAPAQQPVQLAPSTAPAGQSPLKKQFWNPNRATDGTDQPGAGAPGFVPKTHGLR
jgi:hypothetical protein